MDMAEYHWKDQEVENAEICLIHIDIERAITSPKELRKEKLLNKAVKLAINNYKRRWYHQPRIKYIFMNYQSHVYDTWTETIKSETETKNKEKYFYVFSFKH